MHVFVILFLCVASSAKSQISIPDELRVCYADNNMRDFHLPMNIRVLLDIVRKVERHSYTAMDMRTMTASLMHRFKFDGIERYDDIQPRNGVLPFGQTGKQSVKCKVIKEMVPGKPEIFPFDALTPIERCTLHQAISNTIMRESSRDTSPLCQEIGQKLTGRATFPDTWNCPREYGVSLTPYGTIAPGAIVGALAASLEHQDVGLKQILNITERPNIADGIDYSEQVDFIIPRHEMIHDRSMSYSLPESGVNLDNVWLATIAGDLAEMVAYQGPILGPDMELGATGFWNNTMRPNVYYLKNKSGCFDATRAEILGDIDGLIIANHVQSWVDEFNSLRLSQILDMYYSGEGITLLNKSVNVCDRKKTLAYSMPKTLLEEQTFVASYVLAYLNSITFTSPEILKQMVNYALDKFSVYVNDHLLTGLFCRGTKHYPQVETLIVFDGAWTKEHTMDFIASLIDDLDVSMYGSKMGILHGATGHWLLNVTDSPSLAYHVVSNFTKISWPTHLNLITTLNAIRNYLNETWEIKWRQHVVGGLGQAILILAPRTQLTEEERRIILNLLQEIKHVHPDLNFLYYVSQQNLHVFESFILSEHDRLILNPHIDDIVRFLSIVPRTLRPVPESTNVSSEIKNEVEGYIRPSKSIAYALHPRYIADRLVKITAHNFGYGTVKVCCWKQTKLYGSGDLMTCQHLDAHKDIILLSDFKCVDAQCPYIYVRIQNITSFNKCAEIECRSPDEVRYIIRTQHTRRNSANEKTFINIFVIFYLYVQLAVFNM